MRFYTSADLHKDKIFIREIRDGKRLNRVVKYTPYLFLPSKSNEARYRSLDGKTLDKVQFSDIWEARSFIKQYKDVHNFPIYGMTNFLYPYLYDEYPSTIQYDVSKIRIHSLDIEFAADAGFPNIETAEKEVTLISLMDRNTERSVVFGCGDYESPDQDKIRYIKCQDEETLLARFLSFLSSEKFGPDILTGFNIEFFDIPYLVNRIRRLLGESAVSKMSPFGIVSTREVDFKGKTIRCYYPVGISILDFYHLYTKFSYTQLESYTLNYVAYHELGETKTDYSEYGSLFDLYKRNFQKFTEYNIRDNELVIRLDKKRNLIQLAIAMAYDAKVSLSDIFGSTRIWDVIIHNYLMDKNIAVPKQQNTPSRNLEGGYVKDITPKMYDWVASFDLTSLYPHLIMGLNISPETYVGKLKTHHTIDELLNDALNTNRDAFISHKANYSVAANMCLYTNSKRGFLPSLMETQFSLRKKYKTEMMEAKLEYERAPTEKLKQKISTLDTAQMAKKIQLNSLYGSLANPYFRYFDINHAEAITLSGQLAIRWIANSLNKFLNEKFSTNDKDYVIAVDTDSVYLHLSAVVETGKSNESNIDILDKFCSSELEPFINKSYDDLAKYLNAFAQKMFMKREVLADRGIWTAKKRYILNVYDSEGVRYDTPKLKIMGIEAVRSSTPEVCRQKIKEVLKLIMTSDETTTQKFMDEFKDKFMIMDFQSVAFPRGVNGITKYKNATKSIPIHVSGSLTYNNMINKYKVQDQYPYINDGDKIKFAYLIEPNPAMSHVIASPNILPTVFNLDKYIDKRKQYEKAFLEPIKVILDVMGWKTERVDTLDAFFE